MANRVQVFEPPRAISWEPGQDTGAGSLQFGGWVWRYDLTPAGPSHTQVTLSYDWSAVPDFLRQRIGFPPFPSDHLGNSLTHLAGLVTAPGCAPAPAPGRRRVDHQHHLAGRDPADRQLAALCSIQGCPRSPHRDHG
jgi:hypothetical protein